MLDVKKRRVSRIGKFTQDKYSSDILKLKLVLDVTFKRGFY